MVSYTKELVGKVPLSLPSHTPKGTYEDKNIEDELIELFSGEGIEEKRQAILRNNPSWPMLYHLTPLRHNLLGWYKFPTEATVLEIGSGCGAITESLIKNNVSVTALELSEKRSRVNALRNKDAQNLQIIVDNLDNFKPPKEKFDFVVVVGVLEYSGRFIEGDTPYKTFLEKISKLLQKNGKLLLAIENRFGLKYWSGAKEDHVHSFFGGHNGYPENIGVQTFGKQELQELLQLSGFQSSYFFYPFPDYKTPQFVYSDDYFPGNSALFPLSRLPTPTFDRAREFFFSEQIAMRYIEANGLYPDVANSFLIEASL